MVFVYPIEAFIKSLCRLRDDLYLKKIPKSVLNQALVSNPWLTPYYIEQSLAGIRYWLQSSKLKALLKDYQAAPSPRRIGIITAGNIPLVGFHDVLTTVLCGHIALVRASHRDRILLNWVLSSWKKHLPELESYLFLVDEITDADYLLATGSNNTARHLRTRFAGRPHTIRHNRFSVAILDGSESQEELQRLSDDIFLYNGLGCRNVSNILLTPDFDVDMWVETLGQYPKKRLSAQYLEKLTYERARLDLLGQAYIDGQNVLLTYSNALDFARMGIIYLIRVLSRDEAIELIENQRTHIQCVVNLEVEMGKTQIPDINDFADQVNTPSLFSVLNQGS